MSIAWACFLNVYLLSTGNPCYMLVKCWCFITIMITKRALCRLARRYVPEKTVECVNLCMACRVCRRIMSSVIKYGKDCPYDVNRWRTLCLKKTVQNCFCQNFVKFPPSNRISYLLLNCDTPVLPEFSSK